jgi:hypothetical protein
MTFWAFFCYRGSTMRFIVNVYIPGWFVYFFGKSSKRLVVESLAAGANVVHRCFAARGSGILLSLSAKQTHLAAFLTSIGAD